MAPGMPSGPTDLFLPIIANRFLIMPILMLKGLSEWVEFITGMSRSQHILSSYRDIFTGVNNNNNNNGMDINKYNYDNNY
jgi:hypothetical protein